MSTGLDTSASPASAVQKVTDTKQAELVDNSWRCAECGRFALKKRFDGGKSVCHMCYAERPSEAPSETGGWSGLPKNTSKQLAHPVGEGEETKGRVASVTRRVNGNEEDGPSPTTQERSKEENSTSGDISKDSQDSKDDSSAKDDRLVSPEKPMRNLRSRTAHGKPNNQSGVLNGSDDAADCLDPISSAPTSSARVPRVRLVMSGHITKAVPRQGEAMTSLGGEDKRNSSKNLAETSESPESTVMPVPSKPKTAFFANGAIDEEAFSFSPGQLVWTGGRGYQGCVWDPWPGRVIDHTAVKLREARSLSSNKRLIMLFGRQHENDRKYVVIATPALRPYVPDESYTRRRFRDPRGRVACALANVCDQVYGPDHHGIVDEEHLRSFVEPELLEVKHFDSKVYDLSVPAPSLKDLRRQGFLPDEKIEKRKRRTAAVNNKFCTSTQDASGRSLRMDCMSPSPRQRKRNLQTDRAGTYRELQESPGPRGSVAKAAEPSRGPTLRKRKTLEELHRPGDIQENEASAVVALGSKRARLIGYPMRESARNGGEARLRTEIIAPRTASPTAYESAQEPKSEPVVDMTRLGFHEVAHMIAKFVTVGYPEPDKKEMLRVLKEGCVRYRLNGPSLLSRQPRPEDVASEVLRSSVSGPDQQAHVPRDGCFWAVVEFIVLARTQEMDISDLVL